jgi:processive 1,2-diacylglycerol beta-glucosyltransferase/1,2-diacylglycerol 3-beta-galactosyltransferase
LEREKTEKAINTLEKSEGQNILLVYLKTGGGHLSAAIALQEAIDNLYQGKTGRVFLWNPFQNKTTFLSMFLENGYRAISNHLPRLWILIFESTKLPVFRKLADRFFYHCLKKEILSEIERLNIGKIVILHFILIEPVYRTITKKKLPIPIITVVTDPFTPHPYWFENRRLETVVFSDRALTYARDKLGIPGRILHQHPIILKEKHKRPYTPLQKQETRRRYGFTSNTPIVLIAGGGEGLASAVDIVRAFINQQFPCYLVVVCGCDDRARKKITALAAETEAPSIRPYGYIDFMADLMNIADIVISKGGPATVMETLIIGKPLIVASYLYGQERGNVDFIVRNGAGFFIENPTKIVDTVKELLENPHEFRAYKRRIEALDIKSGTAEVAKFIVEQ